MHAHRSELSQEALVGLALGWKYQNRPGIYVFESQRQRVIHELFTEHVQQLVRLEMSAVNRCEQEIGTRWSAQTFQHMDETFRHDSHQLVQRRFQIMFVAF